MDIPSSITAVHNVLKIVKEMFTDLLGTKIEAESRPKVTEALAKLGVAQDTLFELREELFRLQTENEELKKQIAQFESWEKQLEKYTLAKTAGGAVVYRFNGDLEHFICPSCVAQRQLQILQDNRTISGEYRCPGCKNGFPIHPQQKLHPIPTSYPI